MTGGILTGFEYKTEWQEGNDILSFEIIILYLFGAWILVFQIYLCPGFPLEFTPYLIRGGNDTVVTESYYCR